ncbi:hypothetical protein L5M43_17970 [Shewanella sp. SW36]|uniref:Uncharacterized protein n=1 Tax=Shewanella oncorhynchi TaxID=2726434 RepID=A0AA50KH95_9GAMM|nr:MULTISPECIES: hypothetical protein [Shewanella]MBW3517489.1 hypothetical protein [Shewanella sp. NKUCC01_JLK]MCU7977114.1 hypothetical protein [Shewanella sp. SW36]MCU7992355.1 hypothetical protein [Shewanella sp. SW1]MCU7998234.1 hypothetical protein [Shewanella sp. SM95]MCU8019783.1 hypothetical protein [Shewanella sp. SM72]
MSNKTVLERLLNEIEKYDKNRNDRDAFAQIVYESIEALEGIPYSVQQQGRDWQYKIETEEYFDKEGFESEINEVIPKLKAWVDELIQSHS